MNNVQIFDCKFSQSEVASGKRKDGGEWKKRQLVATPTGTEGGDVLDMLVDPAKVNVFEPNLSRLQGHMDTICKQDSAPTYFVTLFSVNPYMIPGSTKELRAFRVPVPCSWVGGDEARAIILAGKLCGKSFRLSEEEAAEAFAEKNAVVNAEVVENQVDPGF